MGRILTTRLPLGLPRADSTLLGEIGILMEAKDPRRSHQRQGADVLHVCLADSQRGPGLMTPLRLAAALQPNLKPE